MEFHWQASLKYLPIALALQYALFLNALILNSYEQNGINAYIILQ